MEMVHNVKIVARFGQPAASRNIVQRIREEWQHQMWYLFYSTKSARTIAKLMIVINPQFRAVAEALDALDVAQTTQEDHQSQFDFTMFQ